MLGVRIILTKDLFNTIIQKKVLITQKLEDQLFLNTLSNLQHLEKRAEEKPSLKVGAEKRRWRCSIDKSPRQNLKLLI